MIQLVMFMIAAYGMTTILVYGSIFNGLRDKIKIAGSEVGGYLTRPTFKFISDLISCMLCTGTWVGFFLSLLLGGLTNHYFNVPWYICLFTDGMFSAGAVWMLNGIIEFFEENRIK